MTTRNTAGPSGDPVVSQLVGPQGGVISGQTAAGRRYRLEIPAGAIGDYTDISITPLELVGPPFSEPLLFSFRFAPSGLVFALPARLVVSYPEGVPDGLLGMGAWADDGRAFTRDVSVSGTDVVMQIAHFSDAFAAGSVNNAELRAWASELKNIYVPSIDLVNDGMKYAEGIRARIRALVTAAAPALPDQGALEAVLREWLDLRIRGQLLSSASERSKLVQAFAELSIVESEAHQVLDGSNLASLLATVGTVRALIITSFQTLYSSYLAPECTAAMRTYADAIGHPLQILAVAEDQSWPGFAEPTLDQWCVRVEITEFTMPGTIPDESDSVSSTQYGIGMRYALKVPAAPLSPGESLSARYERAISQRPRSFDGVRLCFEIVNASATTTDETCIAPDSLTDRHSISINPGGIDDLVVEAIAESALLTTASIPPTVKRTTTPVARREVKFTPANGVLPPAPAQSEICAVVTDRTATGSVPVVGLAVTMSVDITPGATATFNQTTPTTDASGKVCGVYDQPFPTPVQATRTDVNEFVHVVYQTAGGSFEATDLTISPDWADVRFWNAATTTDFEGANAVPPDAFTFASSRFSSWKFAAVRRARTPEAPTLSGPKFVTPDGGVDNALVAVTTESRGINVASFPLGSLVYRLSAVGSTTPALRVCVERGAAYSSNTQDLTVSAVVGGITLTRSIQFTWPQLETPPPPPPAAPPTAPDNGNSNVDPDGVRRLTVDQPVYLYPFAPASETYRVPFHIMDVSGRQNTAPFGAIPIISTLTKSTDHIDGVQIGQPYSHWFGSFVDARYRGSFGDISMEIMGLDTWVRFASGPRPFTVVSRDYFLIDGALRLRSETTYHLSFVPTPPPPAPPDDGGTGGGGGGDSGPPEDRCTTELSTDTPFVVGRREEDFAQ